MKHFLSIVVCLLFLIGIPFSTEAKDFGSTYIKALFHGNYSPEQKQKAIDVISKRFSDYSNGKATIHVVNDSIIIKAPAIIDSATCVGLLTTIGELYITESYSADYLFPKLIKIDSLLANNKIDITIPAEKFHPKNPLFHLLYPNENPNGGFYNTPIMGFAQQADTALISYILNNKTIRANLPPDLAFLWSANNDQQYQSSEIYDLISVKLPQKANNNYIDNSMILKAKFSIDQYNSSSIEITLKDEYHKQWEELTARNVMKTLPIIIDNKVVAYPMVASTICGGKLALSGMKMKDKELMIIAAILNGQTLVADIKIIDIEHKNAPMHYLLKLIDKLK